MRTQEQSHYNALPKEFALSMSNNERAMAHYQTLNEEQRRAIATECKWAQSPDEMSQLVDRIASHSFQ